MLGPPRKLGLGAQAGGVLWEGKDGHVLEERGRETTVTWERGDVFWGKRKSGCTFFLVLIFLEFKILGKRLRELRATDESKKTTQNFVAQMCKFNQHGWLHLRNGTKHLP